MIVDFRKFLVETIELRRKDPTDDLISSLINARVEGYPPLTYEEIGPATMEFAVAGNETTRNTLMSSMARLIKHHPDQLQAIKDDPSLAVNATEEMLRA